MGLYVALGFRNPSPAITLASLSLPFATPAPTWPEIAATTGVIEYGAAPVAAAILAGDPETGVSIMPMDEGVDTGPVLAQSAPLDITATLAAAGLIALMSAPAWAEGDAAAGEKVFKKCVACHAVGEGAKHKVGPQLNGVIGRVAGTAEGYKYSKPMMEAGAGGLSWTAETVDFVVNQ